MKKLTFFLCAVFLTMVGFSHGSEPYASLENAMGDGNGTFSSYQGLTWSPMGQLTWNESSSNRVLVGPGDTCIDPAVITALPFTATDNTANYGDDYSSGDKPFAVPGAVGDPSSSYLGGDDAVYSYTPTANGIINISVSNHDAWTGVFVFTGCPFASTVGGASNSSAAVTLEVNSLPVTAGVTYYIVISTWPTPQSTSYTLTVEAAVYDCPALEANIGDSCDDGNPNTINDVVNGNCVCEGIIPPDGSVCEAPLVISSLPYATTDNTSAYGDDYDSSDKAPVAPGAIVVL